MTRVSLPAFALPTFYDGDNPIRYGKRYESVEKIKQRFEIFLDNLKMTSSHNKKRLSYRLGVNEFTDLTWDEFRRERLGAPQNCSATTRSNLKLTNAILPETHYWCSRGTAYAQAFRKNISLSEQQLLDCVGAFNNFECKGGLPSQAFEYIKYTSGLDTEEEYPYTGKGGDGVCKFSSKNVAVQVLDSVNITKVAEDELKYAVAFIRPVSVACQLVKGFKQYKSGIYSSTVCGNTPQEVNHAVLVVGYGVENGTPYWLIKNSWGADWGNNGYFKMKEWILSLTQPQKLAHKGRIAQVHIRRPKTTYPTDVGLLTLPRTLRNGHLKRGQYKRGAQHRK